MTKANVSVIIPCAGFGRRMGSPPAKELLPHPTSAKPLIQAAIERFADLDARLVVVTRAEKKELIEWCAKQPRVEVLQIEATREWPDSVLASQNFWSERNLLLLPDTDFSPESAPLQLLEDLNQVDVAFASFPVADKRNWGLFLSTAGGFSVADKPELVRPESQAWGLIAFSNRVGRSLFSTISNANRDRRWHSMEHSMTARSLDWFKDLTRGLETADAQPVPTDSAKTTDHQTPA